MSQITNLKFPRIGNTYSAEKQDALENATESNGADTDDVFSVLRAGGQGTGLGSGTVSGTSALVGTGTNFTNELKLGDRFYVNDQVTVVNVITDASNLTVIPPLDPAVVNANYSYRTAGPYIFVVQTDNAGVSLTDEFQLPLIASGVLNFTVTGPALVGSPVTITAFNDAATLLKFTSAGTHTVTATANAGTTVNGWQFNNGGDKFKLLDVTQWGNFDLSENAAFFGCSNFVCTATDPALVSTTDMGLTFANCAVFNGAIGNWNVSNVTDLEFPFSGADIFNQPLNNWDVSSLTNMRGTFDNALSFNQPLNNWDVSNVTDMEFLFLFATAFNQDINSWNVSNVTNMRFVFSGANAFNQPLGNWDVSSVTSMESMFEDCPFDQDISIWNISNVLSLRFMFNRSAFNQNINIWDVSNVTDMSFTFDNSAFNQPLNSWNVLSVTTMSNMFNDNLVFNQDIGIWNVSNVTDMSQMFKDSVFNQDISSWQIQLVTTMALMFDNGSLSTTNYDLLLVAWDALIVQSGVPFGVGTTQFSAGTAAAARQSLIDNDLWSITDGGQVP